MQDAKLADNMMFNLAIDFEIGMNSGCVSSKKGII
jgi:hypothetical protein